MLIFRQERGCHILRATHARQKRAILCGHLPTVWIPISHVCCVNGGLVSQVFISLEGKRAIVDVLVNIEVQKD